MLFFTSKLLLALPGLSLAADNGGAFGPFEGHCEHGCAVYCWGGQESCRIYGPAKTTVWPWYGGCKGATKCEAYGLCGPQCLDDHGSPYVGLPAQAFCLEILVRDRTSVGLVIVKFLLLTLHRG
jgi:hypothetical protein